MPTTAAHQALFWDDKHEGVAVLLVTLAVSIRSWCDVRRRIANIVRILVP